MLTTIAFFVVPILISPLVVYVSSRLFPIFLELGSKLFVAMDLPGSLLRKVGMDIAVRCVVIYLICWIAGYGCYVIEWPYPLAVGICVSGVFLALFGTILLVKKEVGVKTWTDASLVGLVAYSGGNLPLILIIPPILFFV